MQFHKKIKNHVVRHKELYFGLGVGAVVGASIVALKRTDGLQTVRQINLFSPRSAQNVVQLSLPERSTPSKPIWDTVNEKAYASINEAVRQTGRTRSAILDDPTFELFQSPSQ